AVFNCSVPIISAVGHETDTTIIDFVADLRAPTPSAAAELAVWEVRDIFDGMARYEEALRGNINRVIARKREMVLRLERQISMGSPMAKIRGHRQYHSQLQERLQNNMERILFARRHTLDLYLEKFRGLSPLEKLSSGYSYVVDAQGKNVRSVSRVKEGDLLGVYLRDGQMQVEVRETSPVSFADSFSSREATGQDAFEGE
ncbi:MAG: hypothetical protein J5721_02660, partial [Lachnospiraceae bacterium]|nr:hypothetical protein [Lachnospiraceae bacterium]